MKEEIKEFTIKMIGDFIQSKADTVPNEDIDLNCCDNWVTSQMAKQLFPNIDDIYSSYTVVLLNDVSKIDIHDDFIDFVNYVGVYTRSWKRINKLFKQWVERV